MYFLRRALNLVPLLCAISAAAFLLVRIAPGGPFDRERKSPTPEIERALRAKYHLDEPLWKQYFRYMGGLLKGDLGPSLKYRNHSVNDIVAQGLPVSLILGFSAFLVALGVGIPLGFIGAARRGGWEDIGTSLIAVLAVCVPAMVLGPLLVIAAGIHFRWLPTALWGSPLHAVLPVLTLGAFFAGRVARLLREGMLGAMTSEFVTAARAKGLGEFQLLWRHVFRIAVLPVVSYSGPLLADLLTGSFVVENLFQIPGIGVFLVNGSLNRDYTMVVGLVLLYAVLLAGCNLAVDAVTAWLDPRVRYS